MSTPAYLNNIRTTQGPYPQKSTASRTRVNVQEAKFSDEETQHLTKVYSTLFCAILVAALGSYIDLTYNVHGFLVALGSFASIMLIYASPSQTLKFAWLSFFAFCVGCNLGPLIAISLDQDANLVLTALLSTSGMFLCLSAAAFVAPSKKFFFLGGILSSAISGLCIIGLLNLFFRSPAIASASIYLGVLVYSGFVLFNTQVILEKAKRGDKNFVTHALALFTDFVGLFVRILILLNKNQKKRSSKR